MYDVVRVECEVTCPECGNREWVTMEPDHSPYVLVCDQCLNTTAPTNGECCMFCAYGTSQCLPRQKAIRVLQEQSEQLEISIQAAA